MKLEVFMTVSNDVQKMAEEANNEQHFDAAFDEFSKDNTSDEQDHDAQNIPNEESNAPAVEDKNETLENLRQEIEQLKKEYQPVENEGATSVQPPIIDENKSDFMQGEEWEALQEDLPDFANIIEAQAKQISDLSAQMQGVTEQSVQQYQDQQIKIMDETIPDWRDVSGSEYFSSWVQSQPDQVQQLAQSADASEVSWIINLYKQSATEDIQAKRQQSAQSAVELQTRNSGSMPSGSVPDDFDKAFDYYSK